MPTPPASTKTSLGQRLHQHARTRWPQLSAVRVRFRGPFAYLQGQLPDGEVLPLCRLRYHGYANEWGFAIYQASHDDYQDSVLPSGQLAANRRRGPRLRLRPLPSEPGAWLTDPSPTN